MSETKREAVYEVRLQAGPALTNFEQLKKRLSEVAFERKNLNKAINDSLKQEAAITEAVKAQGFATKQQQADLARLVKGRELNNRALSDQAIQEKFLSAQIRETGNDLARLTELGLRFRDKMADATLQALRQSGALEQLTTRQQVLQNEIGQTGTANKFADTAAFAGKAAGTVLTFAGVLTGGDNLVVTGVHAIGDGAGGLTVTVLALPSA